MNEFAGRHNARSEDTLDQMAGIACRMSGRRLPYAHLIADKCQPAPRVGSEIF